MSFCPRRKQDLLAHFIHILHHPVTKVRNIFLSVAKARIKIPCRAYTQERIIVTKYNSFIRNFKNIAAIDYQQCAEFSFSDWQKIMPQSSRITGCNISILLKYSAMRLLFDSKANGFFFGEVENRNFGSTFS